MTVYGGELEAGPRPEGGYRLRARLLPVRVTMEETATKPSTFLFSDVEASTALLRRLRDSYGTVIGEHEQLLRAAWAQAGGRELDADGDSFSSPSAGRGRQSTQPCQPSEPSPRTPGPRESPCAFASASTRVRHRSPSISTSPRGAQGRRICGRRPRRPDLALGDDAVTARGRGAGVRGLRVARPRRAAAEGTSTAPSGSTSLRWPGSKTGFPPLRTAGHGRRRSPTVRTSCPARRMPGSCAF